MGLATCAAFFSIFVQFSSIKTVISFNLDTDYAVIKKGPPGSFFGFAVAEHQVTYGGVVEQWILASAPKANTSLFSGSVEPGTVFKCNAKNSSSECTQEIAFDIRTSAPYENKDHQWFGVSVMSGGKDKDVAACAHRYLRYALSGQYDLLEGVCRSLKGNLKGLRAIREVFSPCRDLLPANPSHENYGQCQTGIGMDMKRNPSKPGGKASFLLGAVGVHNFEGRAFDMSVDPVYATESKGIGRDLSYFGYSVAHGNYFSMSRMDVAAGGPRSNSVGKVIVMNATASPRGLVPITVLPNADDKVELASGFGFAICSYNPEPKKQNRYTYLVVGAPFHHIEAAESGQVYIYYRSNATAMKLASKLSVAIPRANFGSAIVSPGDLNLDGYNDLVIGAPYENEFTGAVYVYMGKMKGLFTKFSQKITASKLDSKLRAFGRSLAGGMDLDSNGYNDIIVGAYASDNVALLRSRPVIKIIPKIFTRPATINPEDYKTIKDNFNVFVEVYYEERSKRLNVPIEAKMKLSTDIGRPPRMKFILEDSSTWTESVVMTTAKSRYRAVAYLVRDKDGKFQSYPDMTISLTFSLVLPDIVTSKDEVAALDTRPILEKHSVDVSQEIIHEFGEGLIRFKRDCDPCIPDLDVSSSKNLTIRLGKADMKMETAIKNLGKDTAFQTSLLITLPKGIGVSFVKLASKADNKYCDEAVVLPDGRSEFNCKNLFIEIKSKKEEKFTIVLDTKSLVGDLDYKQLTLNVSSENRENNTYSNNILNVDLQVVAKADLRVEGNAITRREFYGGKVVGESSIKKDTEAGHVLKHKYFVINNGPDKIPRAIITIHWPYQTMTGKHLLYLMDVQSTGANCTFAPGQVNEVRLQTSSSSAVNLNTTNGFIGSVRRRRDVSGGNATTPVPPPAAIKPPVANQGSVQKGVQKEGRVLDCFKGTAKCTTFSCSVNNFKSLDAIQVVVVGRIWNSSLLMDYKSETLTVVSHASVAVGLNASYISDPDPANNNASVVTVLYSEVPKSVKERVAIWKIVLAVLAGIILLALLVFGLYKLGFFKRTDKSKWRKRRKQAAYEDDDLLDKKVPLADRS